jgi:NitT/TauT family transport system substrate-binding protein
MCRRTTKVTFLTVLRTSLCTDGVLSILLKIRSSTEKTAWSEPLRKNIAEIGIVAVVMIAALGAWTISILPAASPELSQSITVGIMLYDYSGLLFIADERDYFAQNGLNVTLYNYTSTVASVKGLENKETDITIVPEYSVVTEAFNRENITVIGNIDKYQSVFLIARRDTGIEHVADLKGKTIGVSPGTIGEFYLSRFLNLQGMRIEDVHLAYIPAITYVDAIANGSVDAVVVVYKYLDQSRERLGSNLVVWPIQNSQKGFVVLVVRQDWEASHSETIQSFLKSIIQAEEYVLSHPAEARTIMQKRMEYSDTTMAAIWPDHCFSLTLDQSLVLAMEDEARWMIQNNLTHETEIPDFRHYVYSTDLEKVKPGSVNIIR